MLKLVSFEVNGMSRKVISFYNSTRYVNFNPFDVCVEYTRLEKMAFFLFNVEYTRYVVKNLHLLLK